MLDYFVVAVMLCLAGLAVEQSTQKDVYMFNPCQMIQYMQRSVSACLHFLSLNIQYLWLDSQTSKEYRLLKSPCLLHQYCQWPQQQKKKRIEEAYPQKAGASSRHITNLKQTILETFDIYGWAPLKVNKKSVSVRKNKYSGDNVRIRWIRVTLRKETRDTSKSGTNREELYLQRKEGIMLE